MPGPVRLADAGELGEAGQQPVDERAVGVAGAGMDDETGRLVDDDHVVVHVDDRELDRRIGRRAAGDRDRRRVDADHLALASRTLPRVHGVAVDRRAAGVDRPPAPPIG